MGHSTHRVSSQAKASLSNSITYLFSLLFKKSGDGLIKRVEKSPDSITDWILDAYCLSDTAGFGIAETKTLKVFQSMFISLSLPYSVIKGEIFPVKASVFNYASSCLPIQIHLVADKRFRSQKNHNEQGLEKYCICPGLKITHEFNLKAESIEMTNGLKVAVVVKSINETGLCEEQGKEVDNLFRFRDIESKSILVEPEGIPKEHVQSSFVVFKCNHLHQTKTIFFLFF